MKTKLFLILLSISICLLPACETLENLGKEDPVTTIVGGISLEKVVTDYDEAVQTVTSVCGITECPEMHSALGNIRTLLNIQPGSSIDDLERDYTDATASYHVIRGEVGERFELLNDEEQELLLDYDRQVINTDAALRLLWKTKSASDADKVDKVLRVAGSIANIAKLYKSIK